MCELHVSPRFFWYNNRVLGDTPMVRPCPALEFRFASADNTWRHTKRAGKRGGCRDKTAKKMVARGDLADIISETATANYEVAHVAHRAPHKHLLTMPYFRGVFVDKSKKKIYFARIGVFRKGVNLTQATRCKAGHFATREEAAIAVDAAARKYRGSPARAVNFPRPGSEETRVQKGKKYCLACGRQGHFVKRRGRCKHADCAIGEYYTPTLVNERAQQVHGENCAPLIADTWKKLKKNAQH